jgi:hypothetical protein
MPPVALWVPIRYPVLHNIFTVSRYKTFEVLRLTDLVALLIVMEPVVLQRTGRHSMSDSNLHPAQRTEYVFSSAQAMNSSPLGPAL